MSVVMVVPMPVIVVLVDWLKIFGGTILPHFHDGMAGAYIVVAIDASPHKFVNVILQEAILGALSDLSRVQNSAQVFVALLDAVLGCQVE